jgi:peptidyl-prolyl cis-trans isomerase C
MSESYAIFRVEELNAKPIADVRAEIRSELQQQRSGAELEKVQKNIQVKMLMPQFFAANAPDPSSGQPVSAVDPAGIVAEVNGRRIVAKDLAEIMQGMSPTARQAASQNGQRFLVEYETLKILAAEARKAGLDKKPPASDHIFWSSDQVLMQAQIDETTKGISSLVKEQEDYYKEHQDQYRVAQTKLIYVAYSVSPPPGSPLRNEPQALARAMEAKNKAAAGADFVQLVKEYSEEPGSKERDGDYGLRFADPGLPENVRASVFGTKSGGLAGPIRLQNGFYLFQVKENKVLPFEEVRNDIYNALSDEKFKKWFEDYRGRIQVTIDDEAALRAELAYH